MSEDDGWPSRRRLLAAAAAAAGGGAVTGAGLRALLYDGEEFADNLFGSGALDLEAGWDDGTTTDLEIGPLSTGASGVEHLQLQLPGLDDATNNPAWLWLRTECPRPENTLSSKLDVALFYATASGDRLSDTPIVEGTLCEIATELRNGIALDGDPDTEERDCLDADETLHLRLEWTLGDDFDESQETTVTLHVAARQCRHDPEPENPFGLVPECDCPTHHGISWIKIYVERCEDDGTDCSCVLLGKLELDDGYASCEPTDGIRDNHIEPGRYDLFEDDDCEDTGYDVDVTSTSEQPGSDETIGVSFQVLGDPDPTLCRVEIFGGGETAVYEGDDLVDNGTDGELLAPEL